MKKAPIGILDGGFEGVNLFEQLSLKCPSETFIYINDVKNYPYEGKEEEEIISCVRKNVEVLLAYGVKAIICVNPSIMEYCSEYLNSIDVKVISIVESIINYVNANFEQKNIAIVAKQYILNANIFQKNFRYNRLYNIYSDKLENELFMKRIRTSSSFEVTKEVFRPIANKQVDLLVVVDSYINNFYLEFKEYVDYTSTLDLANIIYNNLLLSNIEFANKGHGRRIVISNIKSKEFKDATYWLNIKYRFVVN